MFSHGYRCFVTPLISLGLFVTVTIYPLQSAIAADNSAAALEVTKSLLNTARTQLTDYYRTFRGLLAEKSKIDAAKETVANRLAAAEQATENALAELNAKLDQLFALNTQMDVLPQLVAFHNALASFSKRYRQQAGLTTTNPIPGVTAIPGIFFAVRAALGEIGDSLADNLDTTRKVVVFYRDFVAATSEELRQLSLADENSSASLLKYGSDHYVKSRADRLSAASANLIRLPAVDDGINAEGVVTQTKYACDSTRSLISFKSQLNAFKSVVTGASSSFSDFQQAAYRTLVNFYDDFENIPGVVSHYGACRATLADQITILSESRLIAESEGNMALAANFDSQINALIDQDNSVEAETEIIVYRRNQVATRMAAAASAQDIPENSTTTWKATMLGHIEDLINQGVIVRNIYRSAAALAENAEAELLTLNGVPATQIRGEMSQVAAKLHSIRDNGFNKLIQDLDFAILSTRIFANAMRRGNESSSAVMGTYESAINQQSAARTEDLTELSPLIQTTQAEIANKRTVYEQTVLFRQDMEARSSSFAALETRFYSKNDIFERVVGAVQLNPIYTTLTTRLFSAVAADADYKAEKETTDSVVRDYLAQFEGILDKEAMAAGKPKLSPNPTAAEIKKFCKQKFKGLKNPAKKKKVDSCIKKNTKPSNKKAAKWIDLLTQQQAFMTGRIGAEVSDASKEHLEGASITDILGQMTADRNEMLKLAQ